MKNYMVLLIVLNVFLSFSQNQNAEAQKLLTSLITKNNIVGASAGYSINDSIIWQSAAGYADKKSNTKFTLETKVRIASIAKSMTALAVMQLVEQDLIAIDVPIQTYIPEYPKQGTNPITTRHLLSHTSGISGYKDGKEAETKINYPNLTAALDIFKNRELKFTPGTQFHYTTYGYTVLGVIIERVSGLSFEEYMQQHIWDKAGMSHTGVEKFETTIDHRSRLYHQNRKGKTKEGKENNLSNRIPGGGMYSTLGDMLKFGNAVLNHVFVQESTLDLMREHHSLEKEANAYGFGWFLYNPKPNEGAIIGHNGEQTGACSQLVIVPSLGIVTVLLSNTSGTYKYVTPATFNLFALAQKEK
ncbi:serine hydrolase domain-containing protein [Spongiimicrobium salis]|uniref:serine hydrolase domain-containing protein n=1 Tax=Spongiimicrobium salis TaxID=1667022 RepID=UPI00374D5B08